MILIVLTALLSVGLLSSCGKGNVNPVVTKQLVVNTLTTFVNAEKIINPGWSGGVLLADIQSIANNWQVGATWQVNVISALQQFSADANAIPGCSVDCEVAVLALNLGIDSYEIWLQNQLPTLAGAALVKAKVATYHNYAGFRDDWNQKMVQLSLKYPGLKKCKLK